MGGIVKREIEVVGDTCLLGFGGRDYVKSAVFDATTLSPGGTDEVQTVTLTGSPTGGTFTLAYKGQTTGNIAYNASAATVQTALRALSRIGSNGASVAGSAGGPYTVTFGGQLAKQNVEMLVGDDALTGGTAPEVAVTEATKGSSDGAGRYLVRSGLVVMKTTSGEMVEEWDGGSPSDILGIIDGFFEFIGNVPAASREVPVYGRTCTFDASKIKGYAANEVDLKTWAATVDAVFEEGIV